MFSERLQGIQGDRTENTRNTQDRQITIDNNRLVLLPLRYLGHDAIRFMILSYQIPKIEYLADNTT